MLAKMGIIEAGQPVNQTQFSAHFERLLPKDEDEFDDEVCELMQAASACRQRVRAKAICDSAHKGKGECRY